MGKEKPKSIGVWPVVKSFVNGRASGMLATCVIQPIDMIKGPTEKEQIDVQGDIFMDIVEFITETWPDVPETAIYFIEDGRKLPAA